jgi:hypothetical protein
MTAARPVDDPKRRRARDAAITKGFIRHLGLEPVGANISGGSSAHAESRSTEGYAKLGDLALVSVIRPRTGRVGAPDVDPSPDPAAQLPRSTTTSGGADGTRTRNFRRDRPVL